MTNHGLYVNSATGAAATTADMVDGALMIGKTGGVPVATTLTSGSGISITNAANSITIAASGGAASGSTPNSIFQAYKHAGNQSISGRNTDLVTFDTIKFQNGTAYNAGTSTYTAPATGYYHLLCSLFINESAASYGFQINVNGSLTTPALYQTATPSGSGQQFDMIEYYLLLNSGDAVTITYYTQSGATLYNDQCFFQMSLIQNAAFVWQEITGASANLVPNNGYIANRNSLVTLTLPTTSAVGSIIEIVGKGTGGWKVAQNANQMIHIKAATSTTGTGGYISSNDQYNSVKLLCTVANLEFTVLSSEGTLNLN